MLRCFVVLVLFMLGPACALACPPLPPEQARALSLEAALQRVPQCPLDVRAALAALQAARADEQVAAQRPNPQLTLAAASLPRRGLGGGTLWDKAFDHQARIDQLIERGGKAEARVAGAAAQREAADAALGDATRQARLAVSQAFHELVGALGRWQESAAAAELAQQAQQAMERRVRAGDAPPLDATRFALDTLRVQGDLRQAEADLQSARLQLALLLGAADRAEELTPASPAAAGLPAPEGAAADAAQDQAALARRPDLRAAAARVAAAEQALALARAQTTRDVDVGLQFDRFPPPGGGGGPVNTVGVYLSMPLFVRHAYEGEQRRAQADLESARVELERVRQQAQHELAAARVQWLAAEARQRLVSEQMLPAAEQVARGAELAFQRGATSVLDLLDARRSLRGARIESITAAAERAKAAAALAAALPPADSNAVSR